MGVIRRFRQVQVVVARELFQQLFDKFLCIASSSLSAVKAAMLQLSTRFLDCLDIGQIVSGVGGRSRSRVTLDRWHLSHKRVKAYVVIQWPGFRLHFTP